MKSYTASSNLVSLALEKTVVSLVDMILMEESSRDKHSKTGTVIKLKTENTLGEGMFIFENK